MKKLHFCSVSFTKRAFYVLFYHRILSCRRKVIILHHQVKQLIIRVLTN